MRTLDSFLGKWHLCNVINVDCSLVQVFYDVICRTEWIYRGSTRLSPMYREERAATNRHSGVRNISRKLGPVSIDDISCTMVLTFLSIFRTNLLQWYNTQETTILFLTVPKGNNLLALQVLELLQERVLPDLSITSPRT